MSTSAAPKAAQGDAKHLYTIIVLGASGDLAKKKTFPALFGLFKNKYLNPKTRIIGYARTKMDQGTFEGHITQYLKIGKKTEGSKEEDEKEVVKQFLALCSYQDGQYDRDEDFRRLEEKIVEAEKASGATARLFYMALPPSVFIPVATSLKKNNYHKSNGGGIVRLIVEKPFGMDLESSRKLGKDLGALFTEDEIYRIDHYLGKEMVKNLMILRFANVIFGSVWNRQCIDNVQITFKEKIGTAGRGGYFDEFGIIRDVMQNPMESPVSLGAEDVRDEKVKVLRFIPPIVKEDILLGQYTKSEDGKEPGYLDDKTVPKGSKTPTYAAATLYIHNERWSGVPFVLKCGKALDQQKTEIRIQFKDIPGSLFSNLARNEIVIRVQPNEAVYVKMMNKEPGLGMKTIISDLDLSYSSRFNDSVIPEAYESLILDALNGDHSNFVRDDELDAAWKIFTPILKTIDAGGVDPVPYAYGSRGPTGVAEFVRKHGYKRSEQEYVWPQHSEAGKEAKGQDQKIVNRKLEMLRSFSRLAVSSLRTSSRMTVASFHTARVHAVGASPNVATSPSTPLPPRMDTTTGAAASLSSKSVKKATESSSSSSSPSTPTSSKSSPAEESTTVSAAGTVEGQAENNDSDNTESGDNNAEYRSFQDFRPVAPEKARSLTENPILLQLVNTIMKDGKKARAQRFLADAMLEIRSRTQSDPYHVVLDAIELASPILKLTATKKGSKVLQVPTPMTERQRRRRAIVWILEASDKRKGEKLFKDRLASEFLAVVNGNSGALLKKNAQHKMALANRANAALKY
ncbi:Glucose-6-phosphate 1-dehydrogenase [Podila epigama]|nr:Glucose-6-phosphate 1-dehydrogenase [Podila epigama]